MEPKELKLIVKEKYSEIADQSREQNQSSCCGSTCGCNTTDMTIFSADYSNLEGYVPDADLGLGCGIPTEFAGIKKGDHVLDLGSGAGNDCFVASWLTGEEGNVTGLDFTEKMIEKARANLAKTGFKNIEFVYGDIEDMPLPDAKFDVVLSNCVLNLVPDKEKAFNQIYRVLKTGGHFCISDVVLLGKLPDNLRNEAEMYAGCVSGALQKEDYLATIRKAGFTNIKIKREVQTVIPDEILLSYLSAEELKKYRNKEHGIFSITVVGRKE